MDDGCFKKYIIVKELADTVYKVRLEGKGGFYVLKILTLELAMLSTEDILERTVCFTLLFSKHNLGPKVVDHFRCKEGWALVTEYLENRLGDVPNKILDEKIKKMHSMGIVHADLHYGNIRCNSKGEPFIIDLDTTFFEEEFYTQSFPSEWLNRGFDFDWDGLEDFKQHELVNYIETSDMKDDIDD